MDKNPTGDDGARLKAYWIAGPGVARWDTFTELRAHLVKYLPPPVATKTAAAWFHLRFGFWPGADVNRVRHGKPPRGKIVGPG